MTIKNNKPVRKNGMLCDILMLALPAIFSNIAVPFLGLSDTTISGHLGSTAYIGAIAVGTMMMNVVFWLFGFLRMGTTGLTAQAYGSGNDRKIRLIFSQAMLIAFVVGVAILALRTLLRDMLLILIAPDAAVSASASSYFDICIWGAPAILGNIVLVGWFLGMQNTLWPMILSVGMNLLNVALSVSFVFFGDAGFRGIAAGTLIANWIALIAGIIIACRFYKSDLWVFSLKALLINAGKGRFLSVNGDIFFRSACIMAVSLAMTSFGARMGELTLAVNAIMMQFFLFFSYFMDGFAFSAEALCGRFAGGRDLKLLRKTVVYELFIGLTVAILFTLIYLTCSDLIVSLLTDNLAVASVFGKYRIWLVLMPIVTVAAFVCDGIFIGLTATRRMLWATACATALFFVMVSVQPYSNSMLWSAFLLYLAVRGLLLFASLPGLLTNSYLKNF